MRPRKLLFFLLLAATTSLVICQLWTPLSYDEQLIRIQVKQELGYLDKNIMNEPIELQAMLLDYSNDRELVLKAWIAFSKYPEQTKEILSLYGSEPEFKQILINYGESIIPPIQYFLENDVWSIKAINSIASGIQAVTESAKNLWNNFIGTEQAKSNPDTQVQSSEFSPKERGWYAVSFIKQEGHHFLGQFVMDRDKKVQWIQSERILEGITSLFAGGIRTLETKYDLGEEITKGDIFWAGADVAVLAGTLKLLKTGKTAASSGKALNLTSRTRLFAPRLFLKGKIFQKLGKYGAAAATVYIIAAHPTLVNSILASIAKFMGLPPWLLQFAGWLLIITIVLYPFSWLLRSFAWIVSCSFSWLDKSRNIVPHRIASRSPDFVVS